MRKFGVGGRFFAAIQGSCDDRKLAESDRCSGTGKNLIGDGEPGAWQQRLKSAFHLC